MFVEWMNEHVFHLHDCLVEHSKVIWDAVRFFAVWSCLVHCRMLSIPGQCPLNVTIISNYFDSQKCLRKKKKKKCLRNTPWLSIQSPTENHCLNRNLALPWALCSPSSLLIPLLPGGQDMGVGVLTLYVLPRHFLSLLLKRSGFLELKFFIFNNFRLLKSYKDSTKNSHISFTYIPQMLRNYTSTVQLSKLGN